MQVDSSTTEIEETKAQKKTLSMPSQKQSLQGVGQPFFRNTCQETSLSWNSRMKLLKFRWKVGLETRVSPSFQVFSRFMENGSRRSFKAKTTFKGFSMLFLMNFSLGRNIFPTFFAKSWLVESSPFLNWKKNGAKTPRSRNLFRFWQLKPGRKISSSFNLNAEEQCTESHFERKTEDHFGQLGT